MMNINNFTPVIVSDCKKISISDSKEEITKSLNALKDFSLKCEQINDGLSYNCVSNNQQIIGRAVVLKDLKECKSLPLKTSVDLKNLMNVKP